MRHRGFTLIEAMLALAMASIVIAGSTSAVVLINKQLMEQGRRAAAWDEIKRLEEYLVARVQGAGGGQIRPFASVLVEDAQLPMGTGSGAFEPFRCRPIPGINNCTTNRQDRLTVYRQDGGLPACNILGTSGVNLNVAEDTPGHCCLDAPDATAFENKEALIIGPAGQVTSVRLFNRHGACLINAPPGQGSGLHPQDLAAAAIAGSQLIVAAVETLFVDDQNRLMSWTDLNVDNIATTNELTTIHDSVPGFQVALGYDGLPEDGGLLDDNSTADEWLFNFAGDPLPGAGGWSNVRLDQLCMINLSVALGARTGLLAGNRVRLLNDTAPVSRPGSFLAATTSKAYLRNLNLFTQ